MWMISDNCTLFYLINKVIRINSCMRLLSIKYQFIECLNIFWIDNDKQHKIIVNQKDDYLVKII